MFLSIAVDLSNSVRGLLPSTPPLPLPSALSSRVYHTQPLASATEVMACSSGVTSFLYTPVSFRLFVPSVKLSLFPVRASASVVPFLTLIWRACSDAFRQSSSFVSPGRASFRSIYKSCSVMVTVSSVFASSAFASMPMLLESIDTSRHSSKKESARFPRFFPVKSCRKRIRPSPL